MVPDGLVLLTSLSFITGVIVLARRRALAKELASVELLARVDTLCLDKTGTITNGDISMDRVEPLGDTTEAEGAGSVARPGGRRSFPERNPGRHRSRRGHSCGAARNRGPWRRSGLRRRLDFALGVPFSSARKWAAAAFEGRAVFHLGAPDVLLGRPTPTDGEWPHAEISAGAAHAGDEASVEAHHELLRDARDRAAHAAASGSRVLVVTRSNESELSEQLPEVRTPCAWCISATPFDPTPRRSSRSSRVRAWT